MDIAQNQNNSEDSTKKCPFCGEEIKTAAQKCKHCGEFLHNRYKEDTQNVIYIKSCPFCGEEISKNAIKCKHCKSMLTLNTTYQKGSIGFSIAALIISIFFLLGTMATDSDYKNTGVGILIFNILPLVFGIIGLNKRGKGMAIASLIIVSISSLIAIG